MNMRRWRGNVLLTLDRWKYYTALFCTALNGSAQLCTAQRCTVPCAVHILTTPAQAAPCSQCVTVINVRSSPGHTLQQVPNTAHRRPYTLHNILHITLCCTHTAASTQHSTPQAGNTTQHTTQHTTQYTTQHPLK